MKLKCALFFVGFLFGGIWMLGGTIGVFVSVYNGWVNHSFNLSLSGSIFGAGLVFLVGYFLAKYCFEGMGGFEFIDKLVKKSK